MDLISRLDSTTEEGRREITELVEQLTALLRQGQEPSRTVSNIPSPSSDQQQSEGAPTPLTGRVGEPVQERENFAEFMQRSARTNYPTSYLEASRRPDYDPRYWTWSLNEQQPVYAKGLSSNIMTRRGLLYNQAIYDNTNYKTRTNHRQQQPDRFLAIDDPNYRPRTTGALITTSSAYNQRTPNRQQMTRERLSRTLQRISADEVHLNDQAQWMANSLMVGDLQRLSTHPEHTGDPALVRLSERTFFNGFVVESEYLVDPSLVGEISVDDFKTIVASAVMRQQLQERSALVSIFFWYSDGERQQRMKVFEGSTLELLRNNLLQGANVDTLESTIRSVHGSDPQSDVGEMRLDLSRFVLQAIYFERSGGSEQKVRVFIDSLPNSKHKDKTVLRLPWAELYSYPSQNNGCFPKILRQILHQEKERHADRFPNNQIPNYSKLWRDYSPETYQLELTPTQASTFASLFDYQLVVHDFQGNIVYTSPNLGRVIRVMLYQSHYFLVNRLLEESLELHQAVKERQPREDQLVFYDLETVYADEAGAEGLLRPYSIAWKIGGTDVEEFHALSQPSTNIFDPLLQQLDSPQPPSSTSQDQQQQRERREKKRYILIAYNGSGFDHLLLFSYLVRKGYRCLQPPNMRGKLNHMKFILKEGHLLEVWDPYLFLMRSLASAADAFQLRLSKGSLDHRQVQDAYTRGDLGRWLEEHGRELEEYNRQDVRVLEQLTHKLLEAIRIATQLDALKSPTIASLCYKLWKSTLGHPNRSGPEDVHDVLPCRTKSIDSLVRKAMVAGRTQGVPGITSFASSTSVSANGNITRTSKLKMVDVVSLYPFVMSSMNFPVGREVPIAQPEEALRMFNTRRGLGIYYIRWNQQPLEDRQPEEWRYTKSYFILPTRGEDGRLNWKEPQGQGFVPCVTIRQLLRYGAQVEFLPDPESGLAGIYWLRTRKVFQSYVTQLSQLKEEQDRLKDSRNPSLRQRYNPALREMGKLMLNSLSGKVGQRNFESQSKFVQSKEQLIRSLNELGITSAEEAQEVGFSLHPTTTHSAFIEWKDVGYYRNPKPSQLMVFIYAYAREYMYEMLFSKMPVFYSDTDSAVVLEEHWQAFIPKIRGEKKFGDLEVEGTFDTLYCVAPKTYALYIGNRLAKYRAKGVRLSDELLLPPSAQPHREEHREHREQWLKVGEHPDKFFESIYLHGEVVIRSFQFQKHISEGSLEHVLRRKVIHFPTQPS